MTYEDRYPKCKGCPILLYCCTILIGSKACGSYKEDEKERAKFERKLKKPKVITSSGEVSDISPKDKKIFSVEELQSIVGGEIDVIRLDDEMVLVVRKDHKTLPINDKATEIYNFTRNISYNSSPICGDVLFCNSKQVKQ